MVVSIGDVRVGRGCPLVLIAGPCVIESEAHARKIASALKSLTDEAGVPFIFKASYDKANRTSLASFRGPGLEKGLDVLKGIKEEVGVKVLSDVHSIPEVEKAAEVLDVLQTPAFLCRQTDFLLAVGRTQKPVNVKKGQFLAPWDMKHVIEKLTSVGNHNILITERGASFGYNNLVVDMRSLVLLAALGYPVVFDATHSVQLPGGKGGRSGGQREFVLPLARAAVAVGVDALFLEVHDDPDAALCDGPNSYPLDDLPRLVRHVVEIHNRLRDWEASGAGR
jgi:2-dehydro-3-deoxyphosphooctonate aldolase (KDO 8-P synthase)